MIMAKPLSLFTCSYYCFLVCFLLFTSFFCCLAREVPAQQSQFKQCQLDRIDALEPDNRIDSEAGVTETWNAANHPELRCAGVSILRRTINPSGLHLPSYASYPELHFVDQGKGVIGLAIPGCAETYEEPQLQRPHQQHQRDRHQKVRYLGQGDVIAVPPGVPYWTYNYGENPLVIITLQDTSNRLNQLDPTPTRFYLAGNPEQEQSQSESESRKQSKKERRVNNMFGGFDPAFLSRVLKVNEDLISKLQSPAEEHRKQIIQVKGGLSIIRPPLEKEIRETEEEQHRSRREEEEEEEEDEPRKGEHCEWRRERRRRREGEGGEEEEVVEEKETEIETKTKKREQHKGGRTRRHEEEEGKEEQTRTRTRERRERRDEGQRRQSNALEETVCTMKLHENLADPSRADIFNPRAGRVSTVNSLTLPILERLQLSAEWVNLYKNGVYVPHWNMNANSVMYVTRGRGRVQVVNGEGESVFDGEVRRGQVVVVPQGFAVAKQAGSEGLEYVAFKTNDLAMISPLVGLNSAISGTPAEVLGHAFGLSPEEVRALKHNRKESILASPHGSDDDAYISMV